MPFIDCKLNVDITPAQEKTLKEELGKAISLIPGKSETWLMVNIQPNCALYFRGSKNSPTAMVSVTVYGNPNPNAFDALTARINTILSTTVGVEENYVSYGSTPYWGYNGSNF